MRHRRPSRPELPAATRILEGILVCAILGLLPAAGRSQSSSPGEYRAGLGATGDPGTFPGIVLAGRTALLKSKQDESVSAVAVAVGDEVRRGQVLLQLNADESKVLRDRASAVMEKARADLERTRRIHEQDGVSDDQLEAAETSFLIAKADFELADLEVEKRSLRAPFDGVVAERYVDPGTSVEVGDPLIRVTALDPLRVEVLLPETVLHALSGPTLVECTPAFPDTTIRVTVKVGSIVVDPSSGTFPLEIELDNSARRLVPGVSCRVRVPTARPGNP
jgi:membrane fusion protein (multidrug efflux system)